MTLIATSASDAGFTLLELLIAMTLVGLLSLVLFGGLSFGTRVWEVSESRTSDLNRVRSVQSQLSDALSRAYPELAKGGTSDAHILFQGKKDRLAFLTADDAASGQQLQITYALNPDVSGGIFETLTRPELADVNRYGPNRRETVLRGLAGLDFSYFGATKPDEPPAWHSEWLNPLRLPSLIRVRARFRDARRTWPELIVAPRISGDVSCTYDPLTKYCQGR